MWNCHALYILLLATGIGTSSAVAQTRWPTKGWPESTPKAVGLDAAMRAAFDEDIKKGEYSYVDSLLVIRCGRVAYERKYPRDYDKINGGRTWLSQNLNSQYNYFNPDWHPYYRHGELHTMQSVTKTVTSVVIGAAMARGEFRADLNAPILKFFEAAKVANLDERKRRITLRHVLTMTSGIDWNEDVPYGDPNNGSDQMEATSDWPKFVIDRPMAHEPGEVFAYSSGGSELLGYIFEKVTGKDIQDYAKEHVFDLLGIKDSYWKRTPTGLSDTEGGLYLKPEDLAKIGFLYLKNGMWDGKHVVQVEWVKDSLAASVTTGRAGRKYGFQWWLLPHGARDERLAWAALGFGGQKLIVAPEQNLMLIMTGWDIDPRDTERSRMLPKTVLDRVLEAVAAHKGCSLP